MSEKSDEAIYGAPQHDTPASAGVCYGVRETAPVPDRRAAERAVYADADCGAAWLAAAEPDTTSDPTATATPTGRDGSRAGFALRSD